MTLFPMRPWLTPNAVMPEQPRDPANGRLLCSPEKPMPTPPPANTVWSHTNVVAVGDDSDEGFQRRRCVDCGKEWKEELPQ